MKRTTSTPLRRLHHSWKKVPKARIRSTWPRSTCCCLSKISRDQAAKAKGNLLFSQMSEVETLEENNELAAEICSPVTFLTQLYPKTNFVVGLEVLW